MSTDYNVALRNYLKRILVRTIALQISSGLISFVAFGAWVFVAIIAWTALTTEPALWLTTTVSRLSWIVWGVLFLYFVVWPVVRMPKLNKIAAEVEKRKDLKEIVRAGFEFSENDTVSRKYSPALVKEVIKRAVQSIEGLEVRFLFLNRRDMALVPVAYGGLVVLLLFALVSPASLMSAGQRIASPDEVAATTHRANIFATPGNTTVLAGEDVTVSGLDLGQTEADVTISYNLSEDFWKTEPTARQEPDVGTPGDAAFNRYDYTFKDLRHTVSYYFRSGDYKSDTYTITVVHKPILTDLEIELIPPSYTGEPATTLTDNGGNVQALEGTKVNVKGNANNALAGAWVKFDEKKVTPVAFDDRSVSFSFQALEDGYYSVILEDQIGHKTDDPLMYAIEVFQDNAPALDVLEPGGDASLPRNRLMQISFLASDDYGVADAAVFHRKSGQETFTRTTIPLAQQRGQKEVAASYTWELVDLELFPGQYVEYYIQVEDNNVVTGPGIAKSRTFQITVPTMAELYDKVKEEDTKRGDLFEEAIEQSQEFRERIEKITREFIKTEKMEWQQKKEIDKAMDTQQAVEEKLQDIKGSLEETLQEMSDNKMTSEEIGEKLEEIQELLEEIDSETLRKHMEELQQAIQKMSPEEIKEALENIETNTEEMLEKLERTAALLRQIQKEQQMEEMVRKSEDLMKAQDELNQETAEADPGDAEKMDELAAEQKDLAAKAEELRQQIQEFTEKMEESGDADTPQGQEQMQQMQQMQQQLSQQGGAQKDMKDASESLQQQNQQQGMQQQQQAMDKLLSLFQKMQTAQQQMQQMAGQQMAMNLQKYAKQTLEISFKQESLSDGLQQRRTTEEPSDMQSLAQEQMSYMRATEKIADEIIKLSGESLAISDNLMESLGQALDKMRNSVLFLEQNKPFMSTAHANNAITSLNEAVIEMLSSAQKCSSSSQSGQGGSRAQQMIQQMIPQQQDILSQTQEMMELQAMGEKMLQEQQSQMRRLAGQQRSLQEIAKEIQNSMKDNKELLGRLDRTIEDMEAVVKKMQGGNVDEDLVNREQRILSRLLDAQRSIHSKDYEKKRQSETAEEMYSKGAGKLPDEKISQTLREEIRRAMQLKAPGEFEDLIKLYFRALAEEESVQN